MIVPYGGNITAAGEDEKQRLNEFVRKVSEKELAAAAEAEEEVDSYLRKLEKKKPRKDDQQQTAPTKIDAIGEPK